MNKNDQSIEISVEVKWLKIMQERYIKLGDSIENFDLSDLTMAYLSLGNAISKVVGPDLWNDWEKG